MSQAGRKLSAILGLSLILQSCRLSFVAGTLNPSGGLPERPCIPKDFGHGSIVCVCNSTYCDQLDEEMLPSNLPMEEQHAPSPGSGDGQQAPASERNGNSGSTPILVYTSSKIGQRFHKSVTWFNNPVEELKQPPAPPTPNNLADTWNLIRNFPSRHRITKFVLDRDEKYQKVIGIGGAFTDAAGINIASLSNRTQEHLLKAYFAKEGVGYNFARVPIGGTDFSTRPYTYDDQGKVPDVNLTNFALQPEDYMYKIPYIKKALELTNDSLIILASPWSAPVWMKTNNKLSGAGQLKKEYYQVWADYIIRFLEEYRKEGINVWGITTGNEPFNGFVVGFPFNCMGWRASDMRDWIANHLGPSLKEQRQHLNTRIIIFDDNKGGLPTWTKHILGNSTSAKYVDGMGTHWYFDFLTGVDVLTRVHNQYPDYFMIQTEACLGFTPWEREKVIPGSWERGERYLEAIIKDFKNWVSGWLDWNLAVDMNGGPNWAKFAADAGILVNREKDEFYKQPIYYAIGHVSKFVPKDSIRIQLRATTSVPANLESIAFQRPDNSTVIIFLNKMLFDARVSILDPDRGNLFIRIPGRSIQTLVYR